MLLHVRLYTFFIAICLFLSCVCPHPVQASPTVEVQVEGVEPPLSTNILSVLRINLYKNSDSLQEKNLPFLHQKALEDIKKALAPYGYYNPTIKSSLSLQDGVWQAQYQVNAGPPTRVTSVSFKVIDGEDGFSKKDMDEEFPLKVGDVLEQQKYTAFKGHALEIAFREGYLDARFITHSIKVYPKTNSAEIQLVLDPGPLYRFGALSVDQGPDGAILDHDLLLSYINYQEGAPYKPAKLFVYQEALYRSGYFRLVLVKGDVAQGSTTVPVNISLTPLEHLNTYTFGLGYATDTGPRATLGWDNKKLNRFGHRMESTIQVGTLDSSFRLGYELPFFDPLYQKIKISAAYQDQEWNDTQSKLLAAGPALVYSSPRLYYGLGIELREEKYSVGTQNGDSQLLVPAFSLGFVLTPSGETPKLGERLANALYLNGSVRGSLAAIVSSESFVQLAGSARLVVSPLEDWRFIGKIGAGATYINDINDLPPTLRFYAGGDNSVRGYGYRDLGAKDEYGSVIGGLYMTYGTVEVERSFGEYFALATFWDFGGVGIDTDYELHSGVGVGARLNLPFGQVHFDVATPLESDFSPRIHFSVSGDF